VDRGLPTVPVLGLLTRGERPEVPEGARVLSTATELESLLASLGDMDAFAKPAGAGLGYGAFTFDVRRGVVSCPAGEGDARTLFDYCAGQRINREGYILQPRLRPHPGLAGIMPGPGLGTIRIVTFMRRDGHVEMPWASLKAPGPGAVVCHTRFGSTMVHVDMETGRLGRAVGPTPDCEIIRPIEFHPQTGVRFCDVTVPMWDEVKALALAGARAFPELPGLGWDMVVTPEGPLALETNWEFGMSVQQVVLDRGLRAELTRYVEICRATLVVPEADSTRP
jgi:hypothetical protein